MRIERAPQVELQVTDLVDVLARTDHRAGHGVLVDHAHARLYQKRGAGQEKAPLEDALAVPVAMAPQLVALHDAL